MSVDLSGEDPGTAGAIRHACFGLLTFRLSRSGWTENHGAVRG